VLAEESPAAMQARVIADLASAWPRYASLFPVLRSEVGRVLTFEKSAGYTHTRRKGSRVSGLVDVVPTLAHRLMPSARFVLIARDPATLPRSRYQQCLRQMHRHARAGELMTQKCGGSVDADFEQMVLRSGVVQADGSGVLSPAPLSSGPGGASPLARLLAARMGGELPQRCRGRDPAERERPDERHTGAGHTNDIQAEGCQHYGCPRPVRRVYVLARPLLSSTGVYRAAAGPSGLLLVEDAVETLLAWGSALREGRLLVLFTEQFGSDPFGMMNQVLRHVGLPSYNWPDAVRVPNSTRWTYCLATSKSVAPKRKLSVEWEAALRLAYTPVIRRFKEALPCLHAPWREAAGEQAGKAADNKDLGAHEELRRKMCP